MSQKRQVLFIGDCKSDTGPAIVNKNLKLYLSKTVKFVYSKNKVVRTFEILAKLLNSKVVIMSGISKANLIVFKLRKITNVKVLYLMHGSVIKENEINRTSNSSAENLEKYHLSNSDLIICVSKKFMEWMNDQYPELKYKLKYVTNGIDWKLLSKRKTEMLSGNKIERMNNYIMSIGGGMPRKNILQLCKAISLINNESSLNLKLIVLGNQGDDINEIVKYPFVEYYGSVSYKKVFEYYNRSCVYIQNSLFETFGLAPIEALLSGCNLLLSKEVGAIDLIEGISELDIIYDTNNINEIKEKTLYLLSNSNNERLINSINITNTSLEHQANSLLRLIEKDII